MGESHAESTCRRRDKSDDDDDDEREIETHFRSKRRRRRKGGKKSFFKDVQRKRGGFLSSPLFFLVLVAVTGGYVSRCFEFSADILAMGDAAFRSFLLGSGTLALTNDPCNIRLYGSANRRAWAKDGFAPGGLEI